MPTLNYLKSILKKVQEQVKVLESGLRHVESEKKKLDKKQRQFTEMIKLRKKDVDNVLKQIEEIQKIQIKEGLIDRWQNLIP